LRNESNLDINDDTFKADNDKLFGVKHEDFEEESKMIASEYL